MMIWALRQLTVPVNYLRIRHGRGIFRSKLTYDFVLPTILAALTLAAFAWLGISFALYDHPDLVKRISDLLSLMIVFYMAALAAVATFDRPGIDNYLPDNDAILSIRNPDGGKWEDVPLSYRKFISYLFGYLSFLSLCLFIFLALLDVGWKKVEEHFSSNVLIHQALTMFADPIIFFATFFAIWQLFITSLLGIYFLTERIQTLNDQ